MAIELYKNQKQKQKKAHKISNSFYWVDMVTNTNYEIYALIIIKIFSYFPFAFFVVEKKIEFLKISKAM